MAMQDEFAFPSLDFPGRSTITLAEIAQRIGTTERHIANLIEGGELAALDCGRTSRGRKWHRVPIEAWHAYIYERLSAPTGGQLLAGMTDAALQRLLIDAADRLRIRGQNPITLLTHHD